MAQKTYGRWAGRHEPVLQPPLEGVALRSRLILYSSQLDLEVEETPVAVDERLPPLRGIRAKSTDARADSLSATDEVFPPRGGGSVQRRPMPMHELILYSSLDG
eukprot:scaffold22491_cov112-Skeletonema_dohrnii-CCMP3373.AAC.1